MPRGPDGEIDWTVIILATGPDPRVITVSLLGEAEGTSRGEGEDHLEYVNAISRAD